MNPDPFVLGNITSTSSGRYWLNNKAQDTTFFNRVHANGVCSYFVVRNNNRPITKSLGLTALNTPTDICTTPNGLMNGLNTGSSSPVTFLDDDEEPRCQYCGLTTCYEECIEA